MAKVVEDRLLRYTGEVQPKPGEQDSQTGQLLYPYLCDSGLIEAVNLAIYLRRPLLLKGEPGCGKTRLARSVAYELNLEFKAWNIKSTSRAQDGLYRYDTVARLRDAQLASSDRLTDEQVRLTDDPNTYLSWGPLGEAFRSSQTTVVLIDEIDKADIDFPNDLLFELEQLSFEVIETGELIRASSPPIVFITSNDEKDLPPAFLRRCLFYYVEFPRSEQLGNIVNAHFPEGSQTLVNKAIERFLELREKMQQNRGSSGKKVSTSELIDWFRVLSEYAQGDDILSQLDDKIPFSSVLLKSWDDHKEYINRQQ